MGKITKPRLRAGEFVLGKRYTDYALARRAWVRALRKGHRGRIVHHRDRTFSLVMYA